MGDVLEYQGRWTVTKPLAPGQFWFTEQARGDNIDLHATLRIAVPRERTVKWRSATSQPAIAEVGNLRTFTWTQSRLAHKSKEEIEEEQAKLMDAIGRGRVPQPDIQLSSFTSWGEVGRLYEQLQQERVKPTPEVRAKAAELTKGLTDDRAKTEAIYRYVSGQIHYIGIDLGVGRLQPHFAAEVLANQYGDCKDKHTLLAALLDAAGIQAYPALVATLRAVDEDVPSPAQFDHVVSVVNLRGQLTWLDTTPEVSPFEYLLSPMRAKKALVIVPGSAASLTAAPADPPGKAMHTFDFTGKLDDKGVLSGQIAYSFQNLDAEVLIRSALRKVPLTQYKEFMQQVSEGMGFAGDVSEVVADPPDKTHGPFAFSYHYELKDYPGWTDRQVGSPLPPMPLPAVAENEQKLKLPIFLNSPHEQRFESHVALPKGYHATIPVALDLTQSFAEYHRVITLKDGVVSTQRRLIVKMREVPASELTAYKKFKEQVDADAELKVNLSSDSTSPMLFQSELWALPGTDIADSARAYDEARDQFAKQDFQGGMSSLKKAVELDPKFLRARLWLGESYMVIKQPEAAVENFRKAIEIDPTVAVSYKFLGDAYVALNKSEEAAGAYQKLMKIAPSDGAGPFGLGLALIALKRNGEAETALEGAVQIVPGFSGAWLALGNAAIQAGHEDKAVASMEKGIALDPRPDSYNGAGYGLAEAGKQLDKALEFAKQAVSEKEAESAEVKLVDLKMEDVKITNMLIAFWDTLGWVYFKRGEWPLAESYLAAAWELSQSGLIADHLGQVYEGENKRAAASKMYKNALHLIPKKSVELGRAVGERLNRVEPGASKGDYRNDFEISTELSQSRTTKIDWKGDDAHAEFFLLFGRNPNSAGVEVEDVKFVSGSEELRSAAEALKTAPFKMAFPAGGKARVLRRGMLVCVKSGCSIAMFNASDVHAVN